jgi:formate C-acetyltransferase
LQILQRRTLEEYSANTVFSDFEELYRKFISDLRDKVEEICLDAAKRCLGKDTLTGRWKWREQIPCTVVSLFEEGCIDKGTSYLEGGPVYNVLAPHIGGLADTVNTLYAIKKLCFDEKRLPFEELMSVLRQNWQGNEALRRYVMKKYRYYGNDNDEVDGIYRRVLSDFADICESFDGMSGYHHPSGVSTFGRQLEWAPYRLATPAGRLAGEILAANASPTPGTDSEGATAIIRSYCKADLRKLATGAALDIRLLPDSVRGEDGILALIALMRGFVELGGFFMQPDVQDVGLLRAAQADPDSYETLSVRVSGWNARFVTLDRDWQEMVIKQNEGR